MYQAFIVDSHDKLRAEFELLKQRWHAAAEPPKTALDAYTACNASMYPKLSILLQVLVTLPVTTATQGYSISSYNIAGIIFEVSEEVATQLPRQSVPFPLSNG